MKHLIIPTDFSLRSLEPVKAAVSHFAGEPFAVTLLHLLEPPGDILGGLRLAYHSGSLPQLPRAFTLAMESVASVYSDYIIGIRTRVAWGSTVPVVRNLLEYLRADAIVYDPQIPFEMPAANSVDARPLLRRAVPRIVLETGAIAPRISAPAEARYGSPTRTSMDARLHPASHRNTFTPSTPSSLPDHAS